MARESLLEVRHDDGVGNLLRLSGAVVVTYRLVILSHGKADSFVLALHSYRMNIRPAPEEVVIVYDGPEPPEHIQKARKEINASLITTGDESKGFCFATAEAWGMGHFHPARNYPYSPPDYVLHLEHDFIFRRKVDLEPIALVLAADKEMAQMSFMRNPVAKHEIVAGGVVESRPGEFERRMFTQGRFNEIGPGGGVILNNEEHPYLVHRSYFTTNPSLMRRQFMAENPWPSLGPECEGRFGIILKEAGFHFGVWGEGEPWVHHIGKRDGHGY